MTVSARNGLRGMADSSLAETDGVGQQNRSLTVAARKVWSRFRKELYTRANCSSVGSAQQYQGSVRYGIVAREGLGSSFGNVPFPARAQIDWKISARVAR